MTRRNLDVNAISNVVRNINKDVGPQSHIETVIGWMSTPGRNVDRVPHISDILEKMLGFKYFSTVRNRLATTDYEYFLMHLTVEHRVRGSIIIDKGKKNDSFYIILQGEVVILDEVSGSMMTSLVEQDLTNQEKRQAAFQKVNSLKPGETFGELSLINPKMLTIARVVAKTDCTLLTANQETFHRTLNQPSTLKFSQKLQYFRECSLFNGVEEPKLRQLLLQIRELKYSLNEYIYSAGNSHEQMYFVVRGEVELMNEHQQGLVMLGPGEFFGVEKPVSYSGPRSQFAVSKSQELIVYRLFLKRLPVLDSELPKFLESMQENLKIKAHLYRQMRENHILLEKYRNNPEFFKRKPKPRRSRKVKIVSNKPSLEWWGVTDMLATPKPQSIRKIRAPSSQQGCSRSNIQPLSVLTNRGTNKIDTFIKNCRDKVFFEPVLHQVNSSDDSDCQVPYIPMGTLKGCFEKKTLRNSVGDSENSFSHPIKKKILPNINKGRLLKYAKSNENYCDKLYLD